MSFAFAQEFFPCINWQMTKRSLSPIELKSMWLQLDYHVDWQSESQDLLLGLIKGFPLARSIVQFLWGYPCFSWRVKQAIEMASKCYGTFYRSHQQWERIVANAVKRIGHKPPPAPFSRHPAIGSSVSKCSGNCAVKCWGSSHTNEMITGVFLGPGPMVM